MEINGSAKDHQSLRSARWGAGRTVFMRPWPWEFCQRQLSEVRRGGFSVLLRKALLVIELVVAVPVVLMARLLRSLAVIRFGTLPTDGFGTCAAIMEIYLCEQEMGRHGRRVFNLFSCTRPVANHQLALMWRRTVPVFPWVRSLERVNRRLPGGQAHRMPWRNTQGYDLYGALATTAPRLSFTEEELHRGRLALRRLGVADGAPFVCFYAREAGYYRGRPGYQNRHHDFRNSDIRAQLPAMEEMTRRGYAALRMGAAVAEPLSTDNPAIIDYAAAARTEFLDIFLSAHCRFFLGGSSGPTSVPMIFRLPVAMVNVLPIEYAWNWYRQYLFIPKKLWLKSERRLLKFHEIVGTGIGRFMRTELYEQAGIEVVDNSPEEITALAVEMEERLAGTWRMSEDDESLQRRFWSLFASSERHKILWGRIGAAFLRQHRGLFEDRPAAGPVMVSLASSGSH